MIPIVYCSLYSLILFVTDDDDDECNTRSMPIIIHNAEEVEPHLAPDAGWNYVTSHVKQLARELDGTAWCPISLTIYIDLYVDRTFLWAGPKQVPYRENAWIGFIHHPEGVPHPCSKLFAEEEFQQSLTSCIALIVFSHSLQCHVKGLLVQVGHKSSLVHAMSHPINDSLLLDSHNSRDRKSTRRKIFHIGHHGRDVERFYRLFCPGFEKVILSNDLPLSEHVCEDAGPSDAHAVSLRHFHPLRVSRQAMVRDDGTVIPPLGCLHPPCRMLPRLSKKQYLSILDHGIVYLHLLDAAAVNTVLECLAMRTPIFVNRLPAIEEVLGETYPLYVDSEDEIPLLLTRDPGCILKAGRYLELLSLERFQIQHLLSALAELITCHIHKSSMSKVLSELTLLPPCKLIPKGGSAYRSEYRVVMKKTAIVAREARRKKISVHRESIRDLIGLYLLNKQ